MDDFSVSSLHESKNEWGARLLTILTPLVIEGFKSIYDESYKLCKNNNEIEKYLMTFQNFITRIPKWNPSIIEMEKKRITERSGCEYLEELITCVHIIQLKILTSMRVGEKQKKIDINIPKFDDFLHKCYINVARKIYKNVYLFESNIPPLLVQKNNRELEIIVQECILNTIRESIPIENILKAYMDETVEEEITEEIKEEIIEQIEQKSPVVSSELDISKEKSNIENDNINSTLKFNDMDSIKHTDNKEEFIRAPKDIEHLEEISVIRNTQRKLEEEEEEEDQNNDNLKLNISDQNISLSDLDVHIINPPDIQLDTNLLLEDIEILT